MLDCLVKQIADQEGVTEHLKAKQPMLWVGKMNNIRAQVEEIIRKEIIDTL